LSCKVSGSVSASDPTFDSYVVHLRNKEQTLGRHVFERDCTTFSNINNYPTFDSEHNWEDLCIQLRNQQARLMSLYVGPRSAACVVDEEIAQRRHKTTNCITEYCDKCKANGLAFPPVYFYGRYFFFSFQQAGEV
jgi:hypothetical protein